MEKIKKFLHWWFEFQIPEFVERDIDENILKTRLIPVLTGPRRSGKSTIFFQLISGLLKNVPQHNILYVNYEDDRLLPLEGKELASLINVYKQNFKRNEKYPLYLFLDEIQNVPNWEKTIRRIYETEPGVKIYLTGSNSKMLSSEIATALRGRTVSFKVLPLSFREYVKFKKIAVPALPDLPYSKQKDSLLYSFNQYLMFGGFPEIVLEDSTALKERILREYFHTIFFADIIERHQVRNIKSMDAFIKILTRQMSSLFSFGKMVDNLKSIGLKISKNTLIEYLSYLEEAFLGKSVSIYSYSIKDQMQYPRKFYLIDNGLFSAVNFINSDDYGKLLENTVYIQLLHKYNEIYYWKGKNGYEVDFILSQLFKQKNEFALIQVCYNFFDAKTKQRELRALKAAAQEFKIRKALIITNNTWDKIITDNLEIEVKPYIQWALEIE